jgi:hypothetical protein
MKPIIVMTLAIISAVLWTGLAGAADTDTDALDRVSVLMPKSKVVSILGIAKEIRHLGGGLTAETYAVTDSDVMVGAGCVYDGTQHLAGQAFIFSGTIARPIADLMRERDFALLEDKDGIIRLSGKDDDTGQPIVVVIQENEGYTTIMTFEKEFYEKRTKTQ